MSSMKDDLVNKMIKNEIRIRKKKNKSKGTITLENSKSDEYTQLLNKMASKIKKKKKKKSKNTQFANENESIHTEDDTVNLNVEVACANTIVPKIKNKRKRQTSCNASVDDFQNDNIIMPKVKKVSKKNVTSSEDQMLQTFLFENKVKKKKKKKNKSCDQSNDEIRNDYMAVSEVPDNNKATVNNLNNSEDNINDTFISEKQVKKKKKKKKESHNLSNDEIIDNILIMSKVPDYNKATLHSEDNENYTLLFENQVKKKKKKKKKSRDRCNDEIRNDYMAVSEVPDNGKAAVNNLKNSEDNLNNTLIFEKQIKKKKKKIKKSRGLSNDEINNDMIMSEVPNYNKATLNLEDNVKDTLLLNKSKKKKRKKSEKVQNDNGNALTQAKDNEVENNISIVPKKLKENKRPNLCDISHNDLKAANVIVPKVQKCNIVPNNPINVLTYSEESKGNELQNSKDDEYIELLNKMARKLKKKQRKKSKNAQFTNEDESILSEDDTVNLNDEVTCANTNEPKTTKKRKRQTSCVMSGDDLKNDNVIIPSINKVPRNTITSSEDQMLQKFLLKTQKKKKGKNTETKKIEVKITPLEKQDATKPKLQKITHKEPLENKMGVFLEMDLTSHVDEVYECDVCGMSFGKLSMRDEHKTKSHAITKKNRLFECDVCSSTFKWKFILTRHYRTHTGEKPYVCNVCGKRYANSSDLIIHSRTHTGERPYVCNNCGKTFIRNSDLVKHYRMHTGKNPYVCNICNKSFTQKSSLIEHNKTHTGVKPHDCNTCGKTFAYKSALVVHYRIHTDEKPYECGWCEKSFTNSSHLNRHTLRMHS